MSTTLLSDIIDFNDPSNESEGRSYSNIPYANVPEYNHYNTQSIPMHSQKSVYTPVPPQQTFNHNILTHDDKSYSIQQNTTPIIPVTPIKQIHNPYNDNRTHINDNKTHINDNIIHGTKLTEDLRDNNVKELTDKYEELCQICKKVNDNNNMVHAIYITIIATLSIILLLAVKKIMNN